MRMLYISTKFLHTIWKVIWNNMCSRTSSYATLSIASENSSFNFEDGAVFMVFDFMEFDLSGLMSSHVSP